MSRQISFCFDDGFLASADRIRSVFDARGVPACFCVLAEPALAQDPAIRNATIADWSYWREARSSGHEIAPHGWAHELYPALSLDEAQRSIEACWDRFEDEISGFRREDSVFHVPYLTAPAPLLEWVGERSAGARVMTGGGGLNDPGVLARGSVIDCTCAGPDGVAAAHAERLDRFAEENGWLVLVLHGVDGEGWGSLATDELARLLDRTMEIGARVVTPDSQMRSARRG